MTSIAPLTWERAPYSISTDPNRLDLDRLHGFIAGTYWATGIPRATFEKSVANSLPFGVYREDAAAAGDSRQIGFARVVSDYATFAYLGDVFIEESERRRGLSKWLMECVMAHPELQGLRRFCLGTRDAHGLYRKFGFKVIPTPENWMEIRVMNPYGNG